MDSSFLQEKDNEREERGGVWTFAMVVVVQTVVHDSFLADLIFTHIVVKYSVKNFQNKETA